MTAGIDTDFLVRLAILEHSKHAAACRIRDRHLDCGDRFALAPQVVAEFIHVITDPRRFERPLVMTDALALSQNWWNALEVVQVYPSIDAMTRFHDWMKLHQLGRKRILDTQLATTYVSAGIDHLITGNYADYRIFPELTLIEI